MMRMVRLRRDDGGEGRRAGRMRAGPAAARQRCGGLALSPVHALVRITPTADRLARGPRGSARAPPAEPGNAQKERDEDVEAVLDGSMQREKAEGGEVRESAKEVALASAQVARTGDTGRVLVRGRDVGGVPEMRVRSVVGRLWRRLSAIHLAQRQMQTNHHGHVDG